MPPTAPITWRRFLLLLGVLALAAVAWVLRIQKSGPASIAPTNALQILTAFEEQSAQQYWKPELEAQQRLRIVTDLWDAINRSTNKLDTALGQFRPTELIIPTYTSATELPHNIRVATPSGSEQSPYSRLLDLARDWFLDQCEFRFIGVHPDTFYVSLHLTHHQTQTRAILEGNVHVQFNSQSASQPSSSNSFARIDASRLELRTRAGPPAFAEMFHAEVPPPAGSYFIDPLIVWDLNSDSQLEVILAAANVVIRRTPEGTWTPDRLLTAHDPGLIFTAMFGDFSSNGTTDLLTVKFEGLYLFEGATDGTFPNPPRQVWIAQPRLQYAQALTAGDIDRDGDLDLFLAQYKLPFNKGQMPFPYFDANDGYPSFLLANDGAGNFTDITQRAGLSAKRARRTYSTSLVDLDRDTDLDLILINDFSGLDAFENNGSGQFTDATKKWFDDTAALGMAHSFADFNRDGLLDLIMIGMNSPTADRLASLKLSRPYDASDSGQRDAITFGNRLYFGTPSGRFVQRPVSAQVARTGWSWGSAAADFDNDGFPDLYIANGHASRASTHDYESEFWLHDIYVGTSQENSLAETYFRQKLNDALTSGHSYGGYERNRLFLNLGGTNFVEVAHLFGLALPEDSRNVAAQDLDRDGRLDLIVTTFENYPTQRQTIRFYRNKLDHVGQHTLITLTNPLHTGASAQLIQSQSPSPRSTLNPQLSTPSTHTNAFTILAGESMRTQLPPQLHLGLGQSTAVEVRAATNIFRNSTPSPPAPLSPFPP